MKRVHKIRRTPRKQSSKSPTLAPLRPKRNPHSNSKYALEIVHWKEEVELRKALLASLQEVKKQNKGKNDSDERSSTMSSSEQESKASSEFSESKPPTPQKRKSEPVPPPPRVLAKKATKDGLSRRHSAGSCTFRRTNSNDLTWSVIFDEAPSPEQFLDFLCYKDIAPEKIPPPLRKYKVPEEDEDDDDDDDDNEV